MKLSPVQIPARPKGLRVSALAVTDPRFEVHAEAATVDFFDSIGSDTPTLVAAALRQLGGRPITVRINSLGGDPFSALTAFNMLTSYAGAVTVEILGAAMSAASILAMAGDEIAIAPQAQMMIHRATAGVLGNGDDMRTVAGALDLVDAGMAQLYAARTGLPLAQVVDLVGRETHMSATQAVDLGFADRVLDSQAGLAPPRLVASAAPQTKRDLEQQLHRLGFSRTIAARMTAAAWPATRQSDGTEPEPEIDLNAIASVIARNVAALTPRRSR